MTDRTVRIGIYYLTTGEACAVLGVQAVGGQGQCGAAEAQENQAIAGYINAKGGMGGRKLELNFFRSEATAGAYAAQAEAACTHFTQDAKVFAVVSEGQNGRAFLAQCLARHRIPFVDPGFYPFDDVEYRKLFPFIYQPHRARPDRWVRSYVDGLHAVSFFGGGARIGLVRFSTPPHDRVTRNVLKPALARHGLKLAGEAVIQQPPSTAAYSNMNTEIANAVLDFKMKRINRVIFFTSLVELELFFFSQAESQNFRPRYGLNSTQSPKFVAQMAPDGQLRGAVGVGWSPFFDVAPAQDPGGSRVADRCKRILLGAGLDGGTGRNNKCDSLLFLKEAVDRAARLGDLGPDGLRRAVEGIGTAFEPSASFTTRFGPGRYDGPSSLRYTSFDEGCGCFKYSGPLRPMP